MQTNDVGIEHAGTVLAFSSSMLRILLVDDTPDREPHLRPALERLGYDVVADVAGSRALCQQVEQLAPDAVLMSTDAPDQGMLEQLRLIAAHRPLPVVMFTQDAGRDSIRAAVRAGVSAYVVDGLAPERIAPILETALARFEVAQDLGKELERARGKLAERKLVERAKGILMREKKLSEEEAYRALRTAAMNRSTSLTAIAEQVISVSKLLV